MNYANRLQNRRLCLFFFQTTAALNICFTELHPPHTFVDNLSFKLCEWLINYAKRSKLLVLRAAGFIQHILHVLHQNDGQQSATHSAQFNLVSKLILLLCNIVVETLKKFQAVSNIFLKLRKFPLGFCMYYPIKKSVQFTNCAGIWMCIIIFAIVWIKSNFVKIKETAYVQRNASLLRNIFTLTADSCLTYANCRNNSLLVQ